MFIVELLKKLKMDYDYYKTKLIGIGTFILSASKFYILWILLHYISSHLYVYFCANLSVYGFVTSVFVTQAPHCVALRYIINTGGTTITMMWIALGTYISRFLIIR